ncbi:hypothetical protein NMY22_g11882 [Coprinellus aureogranulatus]|nr:hypothetical protein NMY22_g11882 [Coprinellus aureogranulatus]
MSLGSKGDNRPRKWDRLFKFLKKPLSRDRSISNRGQRDTTDGANNVRQSSVVESGIRVQHYGHNFNAMNTWNGPVNNMKNIKHAHIHLSDGGLDTLSWNSLPRQQDHTGGQQNEYLEGSREDDVQNILQWINDAPREELALWIHGGAGIGKSTLARHLTHLLRQRDQLAASVLLNSVPSDARSPESVVKVMAREMGTIHRGTIPFILSAISSCHSSPFRDYLKKYLCDPSRSLQLQGSAIFILDAIDEWECCETFVKELESITASSATLKFILLGRSDPRTRGYEGHWIRSYQLAPVSRTTMKCYIMKELVSVKWDFGRMPSLNQISKLAELADGLFIWAKIVCSLLKKRLSRFSPSETLEAIIHSRRSVAEEGGLYGLYHQAIVWLFPTPDDRYLLRQYFGAAIVLQEPLSVEAFSALTKLPIRAVQSVRAELTAFQIRYPVDEKILQIHPAEALFHRSFLECCQSLPRPPEFPLHISAAEAHSQLAESCLKELQTFLPSTHRLKHTDLSARQKYAIKHMPLHVHRGTPSVEPQSEAEWKQTPHSSLLQDMSIPSLVEWGRLLIALVQPSGSARDCNIPGGCRGRLMADVAARLGEGPDDTLPVQISCLEVAVRLDPCNSHSWCELGWAYRSLATSARSRDVCDRAVQSCQNALKIDGPSNPDKGFMLFRLGTALDDRHDYFGRVHDMEEAITVLRSSLDACQLGHPSNEDCLNNLAAALSKTGTISDMQESICLIRRVLELQPPGHADRQLSLTNLAGLLNRMGSSSDLRESVILLREALELGHPECPERNNTLHELAYALSKTGRPNDLRESISLLQKVLKRRPPGHPEREATLNNLAGALSMTGNPIDLQESIQLYREALELHTPEHPERDITLHNLGRSLSKTGVEGDLQESVSLLREALELQPPGHRRRCTTLNKLANSLYKTGSVENLRESIPLYREALELRPPGHPRRAIHLESLAKALAKTGSPDDKQEATRLRQEARKL